MNLGFLVILGFLILILLRVPLYIALSLPSILYILWEGTRIFVVAQQVMRTIDSFTLLAIPLFVFVGVMMNESGISEKLFDFANEMIGHFQGGLAQVNIFTSLIFSGISGSAMADIGGIGQVLIESMDKYGYERDYSAALTASSATVGPIFPPSIPLILYGVIAEVSIVSLLLAGILPALLVVVVLMITTAIIARRRDFPKGERVSWRSRARSFIVALPALLTPVLLIAGMLSGIFGATEAAAVTVLYILLVNIFVYRIFSLEYIYTSAVETARLTSIIMLTIAGAALLNWVLVIERTPDAVASLLFGISTNTIVLLLVVNVFLLLLGLFLEPISALIISIPLIFPTLIESGVDPVHLGVIMVFNLMIGLLTPPLGLSIFVASDIAGVDNFEVIRSIPPYYVALLVCLLIITFVPSISLLVPGMA